MTLLGSIGSSDLPLKSATTSNMSYRTYIAASRAAYIAGIEAGISPQELRAHTGVIGEAFVADYLGVKLTSKNNERGFDLLDSDGLRVSVKTITTSTGVDFNEATISLVDRVIVVWIDTAEDQMAVEVVFDASAEQLMQVAKPPYRGKRRLLRNAMRFPTRTSSTERFDVGPVVDTYRHGNMLIRRHETGSFTALVSGSPQPARQLLLAIRDEMGLPDKATNTTRSLGAQVFGHLRGESLSEPTQSGGG